MHTPAATARLLAPMSLNPSIADASINDALLI
jgi:hypothetical protein